MPFVAPLVKSAETVNDPALIAEVTAAAIDPSLAAPSGPANMKGAAQGRSRDVSDTIRPPHRCIRIRT